MLCSMISVRFNLYRLRWLVVLGLMAPILPSLADTWSMSAEEWARPRTAQSLVTMQAVADALKGLDADPFSTLLIRYPGGEEGALWANELRDWLVSLGLPSSRIEIYPGQSTGGTITLDLKKLKENKE